MKPHKFQPIVEMKGEEKELGICDSCGEYSEDLMLINGKWICAICSNSKN